MNSRERRESLGSFELLIRETLREQAGNKLPAPEVRRALLNRAARQQRRLGWRLPISLSGLFSDSRSQLVHPVPQHLFYFESLFAPPLGWFSFNQLMR